MNNKIGGAFAIVAAILVLFSAMWDPHISLAVALVGLAALGLYKLVQADKPI